MILRRGFLLTTLLACSMVIAASGWAQTTEKIDEILTVTWHKKTIFAREQKIVFSGGVVATYGPTTLTAQTLTISQSPENQRGSAEGDIKLEDPDGVIEAQFLEFNWKDRTGSGRDVSISVEGLFLKAAGAEIKPDEWVFTGVVASPDRSSRPIAQIRSPRVSYRPGKSGVARKATLYGLGTRLITLPSYRFGGKRGQQTLALPSVSFNQGLGVSWQPALPIDDRTRFDGSIRAKTGEGPGIGVQLTRSFLPRNEPEGVIAPGSELNERFSFGYFDNIYILSPTEERDYTGARRNSVSVGATVNQSATGRLNQELYTKPLEVVFEQARPFGEFGFFSSLHLHDIREEGGLQERRALAQVSTVLPSIDFGRGLKTHARVDLLGIAGDRNRFGWSQAQIGLFYSPVKNFQVGAAWVRAKEFGQATFEADRLFSLGGYHLRMDADFGPTRISYLTKYDNARRKWFDNEIAVSQKLGGISPFISYREFPRSFSFGVKLTVEDTLKRISERINKRTKKD